MVSKISFLKTDAALAEAAAFADEFLHPESRSGGSSVSTVRHEHFHWGSPGWGYYPQPVYSGSRSGGSSKSEKKDYSWIAIPAFLISLGTIYFIGQNHAEWSQAKTGMEKTKERKIEVQAEISKSHPCLKSSMESVFQKEMRMLDSLRSNAANGLALKTIFATSLGAVGIGALFAPAAHLLAIGSVGVFVTSGAMLYRAGFNSMDATMKEEARHLNIAVQQASFVLNELRA